jgi:hypothetical protein
VFLYLGTWEMLRALLFSTELVISKSGRNVRENFVE